MPTLGPEQLALIMMITVGTATALVTRFGWATLKAAAPRVVALAAIWALALMARGRLSGRTHLLPIPALAAFVLSNAALSAVLIRVAIQCDRRPRG